MKHAFLTCLLALALLPAHAADDLWTTDYKAALATAKMENRPVLLEFTGSDWCPPCKMLAANVFSKDSFKEFASANLVPVKLDFPRSKTQSNELREQNNTLQQEYRVRGYPTIVLLDSTGTEIARKVGLAWRDPASFIAWVEAATN